MSERPTGEARLPEDLVAAARLRQKVGSKLDVSTPDWVLAIAASDEAQLKELVESVQAQMREYEIRRSRSRIATILALTLLVVGASLAVLVAIIFSRSDRTDFVQAILVALTAIPTGFLIGARALSGELGSDSDALQRQLDDVRRSRELLARLHASDSGERPRGV